MIKKILALLLALTAIVTPNTDGFWSAQGQNIISTDGSAALLKCINFGNFVYEDDVSAVSRHHNENSYKEIAELGFNSVRFLLNYRWFEDDSAPYSYKDDGFEMLDKNIEWAKKYGIGIILNMHYPQGGYQSLGEGMELWNNRDNQERLIALWGEIARRYSDEPTVIGYGLINEPIVPLVKTADESVQMCQNLMQEIAQSIRKYDKEHLLFVEGAAVKDEKTGEINRNCVNEKRFLIDDSLAVYEFHFYDPVDFTHQDAGDNVTYPDDKLYVSDYISWSTSSDSLSAKSTIRGWDYFESAEYTANNSGNILCPTLCAWNVDAVYFDDITVTEISADGSRRVVYSEDFSAEKEPLYIWSEDGSGNISHSSNKGFSKNGSFAINGADKSFGVKLAEIPMRDNCRYVLSGYAYNSAGGSAYLGAEFALGAGFYSHDREYVFEQLDAYLAFGEENNVPLYLGEFGVDIYGLDGLGGEKWTGDVIDWCFENNISFAYFSYHGELFGMYAGNSQYTGNGRFEALADVIKDKLA